MRMNRVLDLQRQLVAAASPSGQEQQSISPLLCRLAKPHVDEIRTDALGNLICRKQGGGGKRIVIAAHMDVVGLIVTWLDDEGFVRFDALGGHSPVELINTRFRFANGISGLIRLKESADKQKKPLEALKLSDLYMDVGAYSKAELKRHIRIGDTAIFEGQPQPLAGDRIMGPYADALCACTALLLTMEDLPRGEHEVCFVFTAQEEYGSRGMMTAAYALEPDIGLAVDVTLAGDTPQTDEVRFAVELGKGVALKVKDMSVITSPALNTSLKKVAAREKIPLQTEVLPFGGTDTSMLQTSRAGIPVTCLSIPCRNIHSPVEIFSAADVENTSRLLRAAVLASY